MTLWKKKLETILMNIYGNTEDSNQRLVKKTFMHKNLTDFDSIKGFLDHEEGILLYKMAKNGDMIKDMFNILPFRKPPILLFLDFLPF